MRSLGKGARSAALLTGVCAVAGLLGGSRAKLPRAHASNLVVRARPKPKPFGKLSRTTVDLIAKKYRELKASGIEVVPRRLDHHEVMLYENGIPSLIERIQIWDHPEIDKASFVDWTDPHLLIQDSSSKSKGFRMVDSHTYGVSWLVDDVPGVHRLVLKSDPSKRSSLFKGQPIDFGACWRVPVQSGDSVLVLKSDPSKDSPWFTGEPTDFDSSWRLTDKDGDSVLVLKSDPSKRSSVFQGDPIDFGDSWLLTDNHGNSVLVLKSDPSKYSSFKKVVTQKGAWFLVKHHDGIQEWISTEDLSMRRERDVPPGEKLAK